MIRVSVEIQSEQPVDLQVPCEENNHELITRLSYFSLAGWK